MRNAVLLAPLALVLATAACTPNNSGNLTGEAGDLTHTMAPRGDANGELVDACGEVRTTDLGAKMSREPYLQRTTTTSTRIMWAGNEMDGSKVVLSTADGEPFEEAPAAFEGRGTEETTDRYIAELEQLEPSTVYCYEIQNAAGEMMIGGVGFKTAPEAGTGAETRAIVFGDSGDGTSDQQALADQMLTVPFDLMLHVGDIAYPAGGFEELDAHFFDYYPKLLMHHPFFPVPGNHEYRTVDAIPYRAVFDLPNNERWYSFDWGDVHFVGLDTEQMGGEQTHWLIDDLTKNKLPWTVVYLHKPPYSSGVHASDMAVREAFAPIFEKFKVPVVLAGHDHHYERSKPQNGVTYFVTGGGGAGTYPVEASEFSAVAQEVVQMLYLNATAERLEVHAIDGTGTEYDQLVVTKDGAAKSAEGGAGGEGAEGGGAVGEGGSTEAAEAESGAGGEADDEPAPETESEGGGSSAPAPKAPSQGTIKKLPSSPDALRSEEE